MIGDRPWFLFNLCALIVLAMGIAGCVLGGVWVGGPGFFRAWLCTYLFWLGVPLGAVTLVLAHDLTGGGWMASARPALDAAIATMPLASLAGIPAFVDLHALYSWTHPASTLSNLWYLNPTGFWIRYGAYVVLWNLIAAFTLWAPRGWASPIAPALSWLSALGLVLLAFSTGFAAIDWMLSLNPSFWSTVFPMIAASSWFNTGLALVLLVVALLGGPGTSRRDMADIARILFATTLFWAYVEFCQFLIVWESDLKTEIPWYLARLDPAWHGALYVAAGLGFFVPFWVFLWGPPKYSRLTVGTVCFLILLSRVADKWWLVLPQYSNAGPFWLDLAAIIALGAAMVLLFGWALRHIERLVAQGGAAWSTGHV
jgi:hypothetical protein